MSSEANQRFGLGLKISDIAKHIQEGIEVGVYFPYEIPNRKDVTKEMLIKYGFFEQFERLGRDPSSGEDPQEALQQLIKNSKPGDDIFVDVNFSLLDLLKRQKSGDEQAHEETESLLYSVLDVYLNVHLSIPGTFIVASTRLGNIEKLGGMIKDESYLIFRDWSLIDEDGHWYDPRKSKEDKLLIEKMKKALVGSNHKGFELLSPIFRG